MDFAQFVSLIDRYGVSTFLVVALIVGARKAATWLGPHISNLVNSHIAFTASIQKGNETLNDSVGKLVTSHREIATQVNDIHEVTVRKHPQ
jgi:hypothetical protein